MLANLTPTPLLILALLDGKLFSIPIGPPPVLNDGEGVNCLLYQPSPFLRFQSQKCSSFWSGNDRRGFRRIISWSQVVPAFCAPIQRKDTEILKSRISRGGPVYRRPSFTSVDPVFVTQPKLSISYFLIPIYRHNIFTIPIIVRHSFCSLPY